MEKNKEKRKPVDWESVEKEYRAGIRSLKDIGSEFGVSAPAIVQRAKKYGWSRDLTEKIRQAAESKVNAGAVNAEVNAERAINERQIVDVNSSVVANVMLGHRTDATRLRTVVSALLKKVEEIVTESELFEQIGEMCASPDENGIDKINDLYHKVIALPSQTDATKKLAETMKILIELERRIFKIDVAGEDPVESAARGAAQGAAKGVSEGSKSILAGLLAEIDADSAA